MESKITFDRIVVHTPMKKENTHEKKKFKKQRTENTMSRKKKPKEMNDQ